MAESKPWSRSDPLVAPRTELRSVLRVRYECTEGTEDNRAPTAARSQSPVEALRRHRSHLQRLVEVEEPLDCDPPRLEKGTGIAIQPHSPAEAEELSSNSSPDRFKPRPSWRSPGSTDLDESDIELLDLTRRLKSPLMDSSLESTWSAHRKLAAVASEDEEPEAEVWNPDKSLSEMRRAMGRGSLGRSRLEEQDSPGSPRDLPGLVSEGEAAAEDKAMRPPPRGGGFGSSEVSSQATAACANAPRTFEELQALLDAARSELQTAWQQTNAALASQRTLQAANQRLEEELKRERLKNAQLQEATDTASERSSVIQDNLKRELGRLCAANAQLTKESTRETRKQLEQRDQQEQEQEQEQEQDSRGDDTFLHEIVAEVIECFKALEPEFAELPSREAVQDKLQYLCRHASLSKVFVSEAHAPLRKALELCKIIGKGAGAPPLFDPSDPDVTASFTQMLELLRFISGILDEVAAPKRDCWFGNTFSVGNNIPGCSGLR